MLNKNHHSIVPHLLKLIVISSLLFTSAARLSAATITPQDIVKRANDIRAEHALAPLQENHVLTLAAYNKANDMREQGYFAHHSPDGKEFYQWITDVGYEYTYAGENLAKDFRNPDDLMLAWMESPTHRANILDSDFCEIGTAQLADSEGKSLVVQIFGCRENAPQSPRITTQTTSSKNTSSGYTITMPEPRVVLDNAPRESEINDVQKDQTNEEMPDRSRLLASGMLILFTVTILSVMERRRHYHHIYKIPIKVNKS